MCAADTIIELILLPVACKNAAIITFEPRNKYPKKYILTANIKSFNIVVSLFRNIFAICGIPKNKMIYIIIPIATANTIPIFSVFSVRPICPAPKL